MDSKGAAGARLSFAEHLFASCFGQHIVLAIICPLASPLLSQPLHAANVMHLFPSLAGRKSSATIAWLARSIICAPVSLSSKSNKEANFISGQFVCRPVQFALARLDSVLFGSVGSIRFASVFAGPVCSCRLFQVHFARARSAGGKRSERANRSLIMLAATIEPTGAPTTATTTTTTMAFVPSEASSGLMKASFLCASLPLDGRRLSALQPDSIRLASRDRDDGGESKRPERNLDVSMAAAVVARRVRVCHRFSSLLYFSLSARLGSVSLGHPSFGFFALCLSAARWRHSR